MILDMSQNAKRGAAYGIQYVVTSWLPRATVEASSSSQVRYGEVKVKVKLAQGSSVSPHVLHTKDVAFSLANVLAVKCLVIFSNIGLLL